MVGKDNLIHLPELSMSFPSLRKHLSELYNIQIQKEMSDSKKVRELYDKAYHLFNNYIGNKGKLDYSDKQYGYLVDELEDVEVGYFKDESVDSEYAERLRDKGFTMTEQEAIDTLQHRIESIEEEVGPVQYADGGGVGEFSVWEIPVKGSPKKLYTGSKMSAKKFANKYNSTMPKDGRGLETWEAKVTEEQVVKYHQSNSGTATSQEYAEGGGVGEYAESKFDSSVAKLREYIRKYPYIWTKNGKEYVPIEGWQFAGLILGYSTRVTEVTPTANGYMAKAEVVDAYNNVVCSGFGLVDKSESKWSGKPEYQLVGFAQTRAVSRALRNCLSWMVKAAGFNTTPAEEMYGVTPEKRGKMSGPRTFMPPMQSAKAEDTGFVFDRPEYQTVSPIEPVSAPMPKSENAGEIEETLRQMKAKAMANNIVIKSPDFMKEIDKALLGSDTDLQLSILKSSVMYMDENNIILQTPRYMSKLRKIANQEPF